MKTRILYIALIMVLGLSGNMAIAQKDKASRSFSLHDSLDHALDLSDFIINANGFVPVPLIITEPALGGFGGALLPVFIKKNPPFIDSVNGKVKVTPVAPNITGGLLLYTVNGTWLVGAGRSGTIVKSRIKYQVFAAYGDINLSFFRTVGNSGEKEFKFNFKTVPVNIQFTKRIGLSRWFAGFNYLFLHTTVKLRNDTLPHFFTDEEVSSTVSQLGVVTEYDSRDNIFTPDNGMKFHIDAKRSDDIFGSDYEYWRINYYTYLYKKISRSVIGGLRIDGQQVFDSPPFYLLPYIDMRGVEVARYQGKADLLTEAELRWDFTSRWSAMAFGGTGTAFNDWSEFDKSKWIFTYGTGIRYMLARKFKLRVGVDVAKGPDTWAYYIVFGSNWYK